MTDENIKLLIDSAKALGIDITDEMEKGFSLYFDKLIKWNERINLTAITDERDVVIKHFIDSLTIIKYLPDGVKSLIDVGTGAGFPGVPVKIIKRNISLTLLDSLEKRIRFLNELVSEIHLTDVNIIHGRAEDLARNPQHREAYDVGTARAVASLTVLSEYILPFIKPGGLFIAMKGSEVKRELDDAQKAISILGGRLESVENFLLPSQNIERNIILIKKFRQTPTQYPRKSGKPTRSPIA